MTSASFPPFAARPPWWGADLQTVRNHVVRAHRRRVTGRDERLELSLGDESGDRITAVLSLPERPRDGAPLVALIHGLSGCEGSAYMMATAGALVAAGYRALRLNLRGAGPSRPLCRERYHAARSDDLAVILAGLPDALVAAGVVAVGYSLGGSVLLKYLGERGYSAQVRAAVTVSSPLDLATTSRRLQAPRNLVYHRYLLQRLIAESLAPAAIIAAEERAAILGARSLYQLDDRYVAPRYGFAGADDYYARASAGQFLTAVAVPTLMIHARDDPWVPADAYDRVRWVDNPILTPLLPGGGGHLGFHGRGGRGAWHDRCIVQFLERTCG